MKPALEAIYTASQGVLLALAVTWFFQLEVGLHRAVLIGALGGIVGVGLIHYLTSFVLLNPLWDALIVAVVTITLLGVTHLLRRR